MKSNQKPKETKATIEQISLCKVQRRFNNKPFEIRIAGTRKMKQLEGDEHYELCTMFKSMFDSMNLNKEYLRWAKKLRLTPE